MDFHEAANIFPLLTGDEYKSLVDSIRLNGQRNPIVIFENKILDGRNRYTACLELSLEPRYQQWDGNDPWEYVWDQNAERRHLTQAQRVLIKKRQLDGKEEWLAAKAKRHVGRPSNNEKLLSDDKNKSPNWEHVALAAEAGVSEATAGRMLALDNARPDLADKVISGKMTPAEAMAQRRRDEEDELRNNPIPVPEGKYHTIIVDPPWPIEKIEREVAPNQYSFDYPTMSIEEIKAFDIPANISFDDSHLFLWTTQKYLPSAFDIMTSWGFRYVFTMVWHKPGGFQPYNLPQYNNEFVLYGRKGSPEFTETKNFFTCFNAQRNGHSVKPDEFYDTIARVCPEPRIEIFSRGIRNGFDTWGNEA